MNLKNFTTLPILLALFSLTSCASPNSTSNQLIGAWSCDPYSMEHGHLTITVVDRPTFSASGKYVELSDAVMTGPGGIRIGSRSEQDGSWSFDGKVIYVKYGRGKVLSSDNPDYPIATFQKALDAQLQRKNWSKSKVLELGTRLVTKPVEPMYKEADVVVTCARAR